MFWGVFALTAWGVATAAASISMLIPPDLLGALHSTRQGGASMSELKMQVADLQHAAAELRQENTVLLQRFSLTETANGTLTRRVGALELSVPKLVEAVNSSTQVDTGAVTAGIGSAGVTSFDADGGSVSYTTSPMSGSVNPSVEPNGQPMPKSLAATAQPDPSAFGIALGAPFDENEGQQAWASMNQKVGTLLLGLAPVLGHVEGSAGRRLVIGPLATEADARELCGRMAKLGIACASVPFIGDPLPLLN